MSLALADFRGPVIYLDAVLLISFLDSGSPWHTSSRDLFYRSLDEASPVHLVTASLTVDEVAFVLLQDLVSQEPHRITRNRSHYLRSHPEVVRALMPSVDAGIERVLQVVSLEPVLPEDVATMRQEMLAIGLLPRDALHLAVMRRLGIPAIASDDNDFDRHPDITLYKP